MKKILVTGANGYIGSHVVKQLLDMGNSVIACDLNFTNVDNRAKRVDANIFGDISDVIQLLGKPDVCVHLAWRDGFVHNSPNHMGDLSGHYKFLTYLIDNGLKHLVIMGSMHEVGYWEGSINENTPCNPLSQYAIAKNALRQAMLLYCKNNDCILQWTRGFYILGDDMRNHSIFAKILQASDEGKTSFPFTTGRSKYDFLDVDELAYQIAKVAMQEKVTGVINCCSGKPVSLAEKVEEFIAEHGLKIKLDYGAYPDRPYDSPCIYGDNTKIKEILR